MTQDHETQATISQWAITVFGTPAHPRIIAARAQEEAAELFTMIQVLAHGRAVVDLHTIQMELADIQIVLFQVAQVHELDLLGYTAAQRELEDEHAPVYPSMVDHADRVARAMQDQFSLYFSLHDEPTLHMVPLTLHYIYTYVRQLCRYFHCDPEEVVNEKMAINRRRSWKVTGDGIGQHT